MTRSVVVAIPDQVTLLDVAGPAEVFAAANRRMGHQAYDVVVASATGGVATATFGIRLDAVSLVDVGPVDTLMVAGTIGAQPVLDDLALLDALAVAAGRAQRITSVCTGAFALAAVGLLDGRRATTHWAQCRRLAQEFPAVAVEADRIYVEDGGVWTSGGMSSGIDLALALVADDHGEDVAQGVARALVVYLRRPGGQSQFSAVEALRRPTGGSVVGQAVDAIWDDPAGDHRLEVMGRRLGISGRHLSRLFVDEVGMTPGRYVAEVRAQQARVLLETTGQTARSIARATGFSSTEGLRSAFRQRFGVSPSAHREHFTIADLADRPR